MHRTSLTLELLVLQDLDILLKLVIGALEDRREDESETWEVFVDLLILVGLTVFSPKVVILLKTLFKCIKELTAFLLIAKDVTETVFLNRSTK